MEFTSANDGHTASASETEVLPKMVLVVKNENGGEYLVAESMFIQ
jgi:hypothetical protein